MLRFLSVICLGSIVSVVTSGCSVQSPAYNPVLGGFSKPAVFVGESVPVAVALDANSQPDVRAKPKLKSM